MNHIKYISEKDGHAEILQINEDILYKETNYVFNSDSYV